MLKIAYIAQTEPIAKPKRLTRKQRIIQEAAVTLANRRFLDREAAQMMFPEERAKLAMLNKKLEDILNLKNKS